MSSTTPSGPLPRLSRGASLAAALAVAGCGNPVVDAQVNALGGEIAGVPRGPEHRPGQPCTLCHGPSGAATPEFSIAGTLYATPSKQVPVPGATITLIDAFGDLRTAGSNCAGNFYIAKSQWDPGFPLRAIVDFPVPGNGGTRRQEMATRIGRDSACASCHSGERSPVSPGWIYCEDPETDLFPTTAPACGRGR